LRARLQQVFKTRTRDEWCALLEGTDACFAGVLDMDESVRHPHNQARGTHVDFGGVLNPAPAPRFSATPSELRKAPPAPGEDTDSALRNWRFSAADIESLKAVGAIR
jgi:alpha-methylacyl-CoA racemase